MTAKIIDGKAVAEEIKREIKKRLQKSGKKPGLAVIIVGDDPASQVYVRKKEEGCNNAGFYSEVHKLDKNASQADVLDLIEKLNEDRKIHGILVQLPLPEQINEELVINAILPYKDADGFNPVNVGSMFAGQNRILPATPKGIIRLIESTGEAIKGKHAVVVGRSNIVGKPVAALLLQKDATVTICHSKTKNLAEMTRQADILVVAIGKPNLITKKMVKPGAIVIDVGTNKVYDKLVGDVDFNGVKEVAGYITPVPGGVGPMTVACLLENTLECMELQSRLMGNNF